MKDIRERWHKALRADVEERMENVSADLPYELQSKMFDQLAGLSIAGAGLSVTLIGSMLRVTSAIVWIPVLFFCLAAMFAIEGNSKLIDGIIRRKSTLVRSKLYTSLTIALIGMAIGALSMSVYYDGKSAHSDSVQKPRTP